MMRDENKYIIPTFIICLILLLVAIGIITYKDKTPVKDPEQTEERFEVDCRQKIDDYELIIVTDRETDVQYLVTKSGYGIGVATMRDTNGMVLLRE